MRSLRGRSWPNFPVTATVISVLAVVFLGALWRVQGQAEAMLVDITLRNMATGLRLHQLELLLRSDARGMAALAGSNPVAWLGTAPAHYLGEVEGDPPVRAPAWYFDTRRRELVYRPGAGSFPLPEGASELRWRVEHAGGSAAMPGARIRAVTNIGNAVK
jgi:hypothetical protein